MKSLLIIFGIVLYVQSRYVPEGFAIHVTPSNISDSNIKIGIDVQNEPALTSETPTKRRNTSDIRFDILPAIYVTPFSVTKNSEINSNSIRRSRSSPSDEIAPSTSYGTPFKNVYDSPLPIQSPPSTSYGVPFKTLLTQSASKESVSKNSTTISSEPKKKLEVGYNYPSPDETVSNVIVNKNVYFYKSDVDETPPTREPIKLPPPQKNYKIIFIKPPTFSYPPPPVIPAVPQNEEKTLVYVLVNKPEEQPDIVIPTPAPTKPSQPEVYFVNYGVQKESVKESEKSYGVPKYGSGYYYGTSNTNSRSFVEQTDSKNDSNTRSDDNNSGNKSSDEDNNNVTTTENVRRSRSSDTNNKVASFKSNQFYRFIGQRRRSYER